MTPRLRDLALAFVCLLIDQASKHWASSGALDAPRTLISGFLRLSLSHNRGALFGFMAEVPDPWRSMALIALPIGAIVIICVLLLRAPLKDRWVRIALALILGGAIGNLVDRGLHGYVVDFIDVYAGHPALAEPLIGIFGTQHWPTFNIADSCLSCGATLLLIELIRDSIMRRRREGGADAPTAD